MTDVIQTVGAYAGLLALLAIGLLSFIVFSQARDLRRLREWAGGAPERDAEVREVSEIVAEERSAELRVLADREERRMERAGLAEPSFWDRLGRSGRIIAIVAAVLVLGAAAAWAATTLLGSDSETAGDGRDRQAQQARQQARRVVPAQVSVGVLNGTGGAEVGLANQYADVLEAEGFQIGAVTDAPETFTESIVMFANGERAAARRVGRTVGINNFGPMESDIDDLSSGADAIVVIGTDHGSLPGE